ncbi:hypothetical protein [Streptomyces sp. NBC_01508]|uniref:hypothetical protein n=1 Tax=Streptomyces sp. NBC_01508 TaxID=2903888 RepID=UPI003867E50F
MDADQATDDDSTTETGSATTAAPSQPDDTDRTAWDAIDPDVRARLPFLDPEDFTLDSGHEAAEGDWSRMNQALDSAEGYEAL